MCEETVSRECISGYTWTADYLCTACFDEKREKGELVRCEPCDEWTIPNDPHSGVGTARYPCATDNHALGFPNDTETDYPVSCGQCHQPIRTEYLAEWFTGMADVDCELTNIYKTVVLWHARTPGALKRFEEALNVWDELEPQTGTFEEAVERWRKGRSLVTDKPLAELLSKIVP